MDVGAPFVTDAQPAVLVQPGDRALDNPALSSETRPVHLLRSRDRRPDATGAKLAAVPARVVGAVPEQPLGAASRATTPAAYRRDGIDER